LAFQELEMRHSLIALAAAAIVAGVSLGAGPAKAASLPKLDQFSGYGGSVETVRNYRRGYRPYSYYLPYYRPYRYYAPPSYYYGPPYARYYGRYGYWNRPYYGYGRRYW
jgi:hypothetical protein